MYRFEDWTSREEEIDQDDVFVLRAGAPVYVFSLRRWTKGLHCDLTDDGYYDKEQARADYLQIQRIENGYADGNLVYIPSQTGANHPIQKTMCECTIRVHVKDLYHKLTAEELEFNATPWKSVFKMS